MKSRRLNVSLPPKEEELLRQIAEHLQVSMAATVRILIKRAAVRQAGPGGPNPGEAPAQPAR